MRYSILLLLSTLAAPTGVLAQNKNPPPKIVMTAKSGDVTYDHVAHTKREKNDCKVCHPKPWAQDAKTPVAFKAPHKKHEDAKASCGACHHAGGKAFESKGNCANSKCHVKATAKK